MVKKLVSENATTSFDLDAGGLLFRQRENLFSMQISAQS